MGNLTPIGGGFNGTAVTMSSREIADVCEKRHDNVKRTVETLAERGVIIRPQIEDEQDVDSMGRVRTTAVYHLAKRDSFVVVAQLSPEFTARLVDRWQELELLAKQPTMLDLNDPTQLLPLLTTYAQRVQVSEAKVIELTPKAAAFDRLDTAEGNLTVRLAAKALGYPEQKLIKWLEVNRWAFRQSGKGSLQAYVDKRNSGYLDHRHNQYEDRESGETKTSVQLVITPKGLAKLAKVLPQLLGAGSLL